MSLRNGISKAIYVKNIVIWGVVGLGCILAIGIFLKNFFESMAAGEEVFIPGVLVLVIAVLGLLVFSITRVIKYINRMR
jgi:F0F1-type ATP synthase membrane subunit c/vacuolar-type H+-ATPase subunit K